MTASDQPATERQGLDGVRVLELPDPKTALCGKLLADMGADVVLVEPPGGAPLRAMPPCAESTDEGLFFWLTGANKRSVVLDLNAGHDRDAFLALVANADVLLDPFPPGRLAALGVDDAALSHANPSLVMASVTNFGQTGPFRDYASSDIVAWAMGGVMSLTGDPEREPLTAPALQGYQVASLWATLAVQAALFRRLKTGQGARLDLSLQETIFDMSETAHSFFLCNGDVVKRAKGEHPLACPFRVYKSKDGHAFIGLGSQQQWGGLLEWMRGHGVDPGTLEDPIYSTGPERLKRRKEVNEVVGAFARRVGHEELMVGGAKRGIPNAPVRSVRDVLEDDQLLHRRLFGRLRDPRDGMAGVTYPDAGLPFRGRNGPRPRDGRPAPRAGQHNDEVVREWSEAGDRWPRPAEPPRATLLEGLRVVELCWNIAGPIMGRVLGDLGATIVKVEPREIGDPSRMLVPFPDRTPHLNHSFTFHDVNRNKRSVTIDMKHARAQGLALDLAAWADVFLENFTPGTLDRLKIPYATLAEANPKLVLGSISGYGQTGPRSWWPSYHPTSAALSGLIRLFAYEGGEPLGFGNSYMDFVTGYVGAIGVMEALMRRETTGEGDHVDISQLECGVMLAGAQLLDWTVNGHEAQPEGNRAGAIGALLQGCFRCRGDDQWIVVTAPDDEALSALAKVTGSPDLRAPHEIERALAEWALGQEPWEAFRHLQRHGVPAGVVSHGPDLAERDEHLRARGAIARLPHAELGEVPIVQCPIVLDGQRLSVRSPAPLLGEHTEQVLRQELGLSEKTYLDYVVEEVI